MERIEKLEKSLEELLKTAKGLAKELKEIKAEVKRTAKKPTSLKIHKTAFKVKASRYNNGSKIIIVEKGEESIAFALNKEDWLKLREFLDSYFNSGNGSKPAKKSYNKKSYGKMSYGNGSYTKKSKAVAVEEVEGYENALEED